MSAYDPKNHSVDAEPHLRGGDFRPDPSEMTAETPLSREQWSEEEQVEHSVWDEPALSPGLAGSPGESDLQYRDWLEKKRKETSAGETWTWVLVMALLGGPWAILGAFTGQSLGGTESRIGILGLVFLAPIMEEIMKVALPLWIVEKRPFYFANAGQIVLSVAACALCFSVVENLLYLSVYLVDPSTTVILWRWAVCTALHVGCSVIASLGLVRIWQDVWQRKAKARLHLAFRYLVTAAVVHGVYNGLAAIMAMLDFQL